MTRRLGCTLIAAVAGLAGCDEGPRGASPEEARAQILAHLPRLWADSIQAAGGFDGAGARAARGAMAQVAHSFPDAMAGAGEVLPVSAATAMALPHAIDDATALREGQSAAAFLVQRVFIADNREAFGYRLRSAYLCDGDLECADFLDHNPLWVHVEKLDDGLRFTVVAGEHHREPLRGVLAGGFASLNVDLGELRGALIDLGTPAEQLPTMKGTLAAVVRYHGQRDIELMLRADRDVVVDALRGGERYHLAVKARPLVASLRVELGAGLVTVGVDGAGVEVGFPHSDGRALTLTLLDLSGELVLLPLSPVLRLRDWQLVLEGHIANQKFLRLTAELGKELAVTSGESAEITLQDLWTTLSFDASLLRGDAPDYLSKQEWTLGVGSALGPATTLRVLPDRLSVQGGALLLDGGTYRGAVQKVEVASGLCLLADPVTAGEHPLFGAFRAGVCR